MNYLEKLRNYIENEINIAEVCGMEDSKKVAMTVVPSLLANTISHSCEEVGVSIIYFGGKLRVFNGTHYEPTNEMYNAVAGAILEKLNVPKAYAMDVDTEKKVMKSLQRHAGFKIHHNQAPRALNFQDGVLFITEREQNFVEGHDPNDVFTYCLPFNYLGEVAESQHFKPFIEFAVEDEEYREYVMASMANALAVDPMQSQRMLMLMGVGASGKSTLIDAVVALVGTENVSRIDDLRNLTKDESRYRMSLADTILCVCGDASGNIGSKDVLKQIISKETIGARQLYSEMEYFTPRASLIVASNEIGITHALGDSGISRRIDIVEFNNAVAEEDRDPYLFKKLQEPEEQRYMLMYMLECLAKHQVNGRINRPERMGEALEDLRNDGDTFLAFLSHAGLKPITVAIQKKISDNDFEWIHQDDFLRAMNLYLGMSGHRTISIRDSNGKLRSNSVVHKGARGDKKRWAFSIKDAQSYQTAFYEIYNQPAL